MLTDAQAAEVLVKASPLQLAELELSKRGIDECLFRITEQRLDVPTRASVAADLAHRRAAVAYVRELVTEHQLEFGGPTRASGIALILGAIAERLS